MNVRGFRSMTVTLLLLAASVVIMAASASRVHVTSAERAGSHAQGR